MSKEILLKNFGTTNGFYAYDAHDDEFLIECNNQLIVIDSTLRLTYFSHGVKVVSDYHARTVGELLSMLLACGMIEIVANFKP